MAFSSGDQKLASRHRLPEVDLVVHKAVDQRLASVHAGVLNPKTRVWYLLVVVDDEDIRVR